MDFFYKISRILVFILLYVFLMIFITVQLCKSQHFAILSISIVINLIQLTAGVFLVHKFSVIENYLKNHPKDILNFQDIENNKITEILLRYFSKKSFFQFFFNFNFKNDIYEYENNVPYWESLKNYILKIIATVGLKSLNPLSLFLLKANREKLLDIILRLSIVSICLYLIIDNRGLLMIFILYDQSIVWNIFMFSIVLFLSFISRKNLKTLISLKAFITIYGFVTAIIFLLKTFVSDTPYPILYIDPVAIIITVLIMYFIYYLEYVILNLILLIMIYIVITDLGIYEMVYNFNISNIFLIMLLYPLMIAIPSVIFIFCIYFIIVIKYIITMILLGILSIFNLVDYFEIIDNKILKIKENLKGIFENIYSLLEIEHKFEYKFTLKKNILASMFIIIVILISLFFTEFMISYQRIHFVNNNGYCKNLNDNDKIIKDNGKIILDIEKSHLRQCVEKQYIYYKCEI